MNDNNNRLAEYTYYPDGTIKSLKNGSLYTEYAYDGDKNLTSLKTMLGKEVLVDNRYSYDHNGNRTERQQPGGTTRYTYDSVNQLTQIEYPTYTEQLYYDKAGNRSRRITDGTQEEYRYDPANHLTEYTRGGETTTFTYDKAGNLTADDRARYTYDLFNRTEKVETFDSHIQINHYDAEGLRSGIEEDGRLVQFIFRGQEVVTQLEEEKGMTRYIRGYDLIASDADSARTYYHYASDELGSITHVVAGEDILNRYEYDAWGNLTFCEEKVENRFKFNGQQYDPISQQYYLRARYYNPVIGRFTQEDTYRGDGLNLYAYCRNNPVYYADPSGHSCDNKDTNQKQSGGSESFADQLTQHVADEIAFNQEHGLTTYYDTPQAEAANSRVAQDSQADTSSNRPSNPEVAEPDNSRRQSGESSSSSRYDRTGYQSKERSDNLFGRDRSTRRTTNLTEWRRSISKQDIHNEMRLFLGDDYVKIDSGKWRSLDGTRQFRVKPDDYLGNHGIGQPTVPNTPHVHFEFLTPRSNGNGFDVIKNIHVPISD